MEEGGVKVVFGNFAIILREGGGGFDAKNELGLLRFWHWPDAPTTISEISSISLLVSA
jgi:hypothetical protein